MTSVRATGFNVPPYWLNNKVVVINPDRIDDQAMDVSVINYDRNSGNVAIADDFSAIRHQYPLVFDSPLLNQFQFPIDPFISLSFKNSITRRQVAKGTTRGTVKERWTEDDVEITITGIFMSDTLDEPEEVGRLHDYFELHESIKVICPLLNNRSINMIVIETLDLPHTKGAGNQAYQIKAYSDDVFELLKQTNNVA
ncbi:MAG TPA: DUF6046 domain-containing protein [Bacteroidales bacterium]|jgi:hypothetical protein|nr:DUF6046 domain-containing protein [Bacteroidales bacterium]